MIEAVIYQQTPVKFKNRYRKNRGYDAERSASSGDGEVCGVYLVIYVKKAHAEINDVENAHEHYRSRSGFVSGKGVHRCGRQNDGGDDLGNVHVVVSVPDAESDCAHEKKQTYDYVKESAQKRISGH